MKSNHISVCGRFLVFLALFGPLQLPAQGSFTKASNGDCLVWNAQPQSNERVVIMGACDQGYLNGPAVVRRYKDDHLIETTESNYINGKENGDSRVIAKDFSYIGQMRDGLFNGYGEYQSVNVTHKGEFLNNQAHGFGSVIYKSGARYSGDFRQGKWDGFGEMRYANGGRYIGNWRAGEFHGEGILYKTNGDFAGIGVFENGRFVRLSDVYDKISRRISSFQTTAPPPISPPIFTEGNKNQAPAPVALNQGKSVNIIMPDGRVVPGVISSTQQPGTINGGNFLHILR